MSELGRLNNEDLTRYRMAQTKRDALELNPMWYSSAEAEVIIFEHMRILAEIRVTYGVDYADTWAVSPVTGLIYTASAFEE